MAEPPVLLEIGRIGRAHGLRGELLVSLTTNVDDRLVPGLVLHAGDRELVVETVRPHQGKWIVQFAGVPDRTAAEALAHRPILGVPVLDPAELWIHELIGSELFDVDGRSYGRVATVLDNPAADILELECGLLVPLNFVVDSGDGRIVVDPPKGLLDLDEAVAVPGDGAPVSAPVSAPDGEPSQSPG